MLTRRQISYSPTSKLVLNVVHPQELEINEARKLSCTSDLFLARVSKTKKSFFIKTPDDRIVHVLQYVQKPEHLLDETTLLPTVDNKDTAIVLFMIHGVGGSSDMWDLQIEYFLKEGYEIVSLDLLGHGLSSKPNDSQAYIFSRLANDVLFVFDVFCKHRNVLIGHSYGSSFCTFLSKERARFISKMVLISGGGPTALMPERCSAFCLPLPMFALFRPVVIKMFRSMAFHVNTNPKIRKKITTFDISASALKSIMQGQNWPESDEQYHADLLVPVLLIYGRGDQFVSLDDELWMKETIYGSDLKIIDNAGHMVMIEASTLVNYHIHLFLNRDTSTRSGSVPNIELNGENDCVSFTTESSCNAEVHQQLTNFEDSRNCLKSPRLSTKKSPRLSTKRRSFDNSSPEKYIFDVDYHTSRLDSRLEVAGTANQNPRPLSRMSNISKSSRRSSRWKSKTML